MPVRIKKVGNKFQVSTPGGVKSKGTMLAKAKAQRRLLQGVEHGWKPTGMKVVMNRFMRRGRRGA